MFSGGVKGVAQVESSIMSLLDAGLLSRHAALSPVDAAFRGFAAADPECLSRETFRELVGDHALLHYERQPWPTFITPAKHAELREASLAVSRLIRSIPEWVFDGDPERIGAFYGVVPDAARLLVEPPNGIERALSRGDFIHGPLGFRCIEFNMTASLGGWETGVLAEIVLRTPPIARFLAQSGVAVSPVDTLRLVLLHIFREARRAGVADQEINTAITIRSAGMPTSAAGADSFLARAYAAALEEFDPEARGLLVVCDPRELTLERGGSLWVRGHRIHSLLEAHNQEARAFHAFKRGLLNLYNGPVSRILSDKRNIALLSEHQHSDRLTAADREAIRRHVPWTRRVVHGDITFEGRTMRVEAFLATLRERLILKRARSAGGSHVAIGKLATSAAWQEAIDEALRNAGSWVVQELVEGDPLLFQDGEHGCSPHDVIWGPFVAGDVYAGTILRVQPQALNSIVNLTAGASEGILLEVQEG